jgi:hypothetical protein
MFHPEWMLDSALHGHRGWLVIGVVVLLLLLRHGVIALLSRSHRRR